MQLPSSITQTPYVQPGSQRSVSTETRPARNDSQPTENKATVTPAAQSSDPPQREREAQPSPTERVEPTSSIDRPTEELALRETIASTSSNPAVNQYQQIAQQGAGNAQAQDPSLFRVDVYV